MKKLKNIEYEWGISIKVTEEWEDTFDKLLGYYNTKDLRSVCEEFCCGTRSFCDKICCGEQFPTCNKMIRVDELEKWMKPQLEPPIWKKIIGYVIPSMMEEYEREKNDYKKDFSLMMQKCESYCINDKRNGRSRLSVDPIQTNRIKQKRVDDTKISKRIIIGFIIDELRKGAISLSNENEKSSPNVIVHVKI